MRCGQATNIKLKISKRISGFFDAILKGLTTENMTYINSIIGYVAIGTVAMQALVLLMGHIQQCFAITCTNLNYHYHQPAGVV